MVRVCGKEKDYFWLYDDYSDEWISLLNAPKPPWK